VRSGEAVIAIATLLFESALAWMTRAEYVIMIERVRTKILRFIVAEDAVGALKR
jgi:hypothetical protein